MTFNLSHKIQKTFLFRDFPSDSRPVGYIGRIGTCEAGAGQSKVHKVESQIVTELLSLGAVM